MGPCPPGPTPGGALVPLPPGAKGPAARRRRKPSLPLPPRYARHLPHRGRLRRPTGPPHPTEGRRGQRPLRKPSSPPVGPAKSRPCLHKCLLLEFAPPPKSPLPNAKNRPGVGRFHTFFGNYSTNLSLFKKAPLSWTGELFLQPVQPASAGAGGSAFFFFRRKVWLKSSMTE